MVKSALKGGYLWPLVTQTQKGMTTLKGGGERMIYFFAGEVKDGALDAVPAGYVVSETKSGLPVLKKAK